ncbi:hypothetical protein BJ875DRAFT_370034 [Amylocarpus encephaloides]|uniref:ubiquitinyl hydrolase 1 n=1 Tax=Amylocarpus encephaloides TaxID=45428 RepID=A0A9P7YP92_9HELO|nr:hypothetical protein BJ875DRAFT_370034 [Amylocarpus encephaloides]
MSSIECFPYIFNHVFLPTELPQEDDCDIERDLMLIRECEAALKAFQNYVPFEQASQWASLTTMAHRMLGLRSPSGGLKQAGIASALGHMKCQDIIAFHVRCQNAGLIVRRLSEHFLFESFELSPTAKSVMSTKGRLRRCFPGPAIAVSIDRLADPSFRQTLADLLAQLDANTPAECWPSVSKAGSKSFEIRDTIHPKFVTEFLTGILRGIGKPVETVRIHKRTRDDVLWKDALKPWRRSPVWLLLRVVIQTTLVREHGKQDSYKSFMIFFKARILEGALKNALRSETLFMMAAKISRRLLKIRLGDELSWIQYAHETVRLTHEELAKRWNVFERDADPLRTHQSISATSVPFPTDTHLTLQNLQPYLDKIRDRPALQSNSKTNSPMCATRIDPHATTLPRGDLWNLESGYGSRLALMDLELWVQESLDTWCAANLSTTTACSDLVDLTENYATSALAAYAKNPEDMSVMYLTIMGLWVALDRCATRQAPLLEKYMPGFPFLLFDPLLLPKRIQMRRLVQIEQYLQQRRNQATCSSNFIFQKTNMFDSLAVQYYEQSPLHQALRRKIEAAAQIERDAKIRELETKLQEYRRLMQESDAIPSCKYLTWYDGEIDHFDHDSAGCRKCSLKTTAGRISITVHEWPLPAPDLDAKAAVFELDVPTAIAKWRYLTYFLLVDVFTPSSESLPSPLVYFLCNFDGLRSYVQCKIGRLQFASPSKPFVSSHYSEKKIGQATRENICVNNGLKCTLYDAKSSQWTSKLLGKCSIRGPCTFRLPESGAYGTLQWLLNTTDHTSNDVLAKQAECPRGLDRHQFYAFGVMRAGHRLQWRNIARELVAQVLNFDDQETHILLTQATWQAGPSAQQTCEAHVDLEEEEFGLSLLSTLNILLTSVEGNWQSATAVCSCVSIGARLLSISTHAAVHAGCYCLLRRARQITVNWSRDVGSLLHKTQNGEELSVLNLRALEVALICHSTFDAGHEHQPALLSSREDIAVITESCITVRDRCPAITDSLSPLIKVLLRRYERLCRSLESTICQSIVVDGQGINQTVQRIWIGYRPGKPWAALPKPNERWLVTRTSSENSYSPTDVHYNVLDGTLLVNGTLLARLPTRYEAHLTYGRIFGEKVLEVFPSAMRGMVFETRSEINGHQVHFAMHDSELIIRSRIADSICELVPHQKLDGDFPAAFVRDFAHWLNLDTWTLEWRPLKTLWNPFPENWQMHKNRRPKFMMSQGERFAIDLHSPTAKKINKSLSPLEHATYLHVLLNTKTGHVEVHLPRMNLDFTLRTENGQLHSKQFRGMEVDEQQRLGTLTGLMSKIVLRNSNRTSQSVIVPDGSVSFEPAGNHVQVRVTTAECLHIRYHHYNVDRQLGRLIDNGSLCSRLFKIYLHATTSHCLVDELTGRTGTEEALYQLGSAATRSFVQLEHDEIRLLELISRLTPRRQYYPNHLQVMQQVEWSSLSPLSQHCAFYPMVDSILYQVKICQVFHQSATQIPILELGNDFLTQRASLREASFQVDTFGAESHSTEQDKIYAARDLSIDIKRELETCRTASLVDSWSVGLNACPSLLTKITSWGAPISGAATTEDLTFGFDVKWLEKLDHLFPRYWCTLVDSFRLSEGYQPAQGVLKALAEQNADKFKSSPEYSLPTAPGEPAHSANTRRRKAYQAALGQHIRTFARCLIEQWPTANITTPTKDGLSKYIKLPGAMKLARVSFQSWNRNVEFRDYIIKIQQILNNLPAEPTPTQHYSFVLPEEHYTPRRAHIKFSDLIVVPPPYLPDPPQTLSQIWITRIHKCSDNHDRLRDLLTNISSRSFGVDGQRYSKDLIESFEALGQEGFVEVNTTFDSSSLLEVNLQQALDHENNIYSTICQGLCSDIHRTIQVAQLIPRISPISILSLLVSSNVDRSSNTWLHSFVKYGLSITNVQSAKRLVAAADKKFELLNEIENSGYETWNPLEHPQWLLFEIENDIHIRKRQTSVAQEMMNPSSETNSVVQLNMGEGKSSVIVPMIAVELADCTRLVRVVVLKPLAIQSFHQLARQLGGMLNRRVYYLPVSRSLDLNLSQAQQIRDIYEDCKQSGSIILLQPEHILSFELMGFDRLLSGETELGTTLIMTQDWLYANTRDILDESDEILSVRFELVYTMGMQRSVEFSPYRWKLIQDVLTLLKDIAINLLGQYPNGIEAISSGNGRFPRIRLLQPSTSEQLLERLIRQVCDIGLPGVPLWNLGENLKAALFTTLMDTGGEKESLRVLQESKCISNHMLSSLLLLKGLFGCGVLRFAFEPKRWRVNYGLDPSRSLLAVPYHAKDVPAPRAEFSHPDVAILLTCLSYYYEGLSDEQIRQCFEVVLHLDHAQEEYQLWINDAPTLPDPFKNIACINLGDITQCSHVVFPALKFSKGIIDFYLSNVVFPKEMKEFPDKLSSSGWDIAREKIHPTTGFSGTNDSRYILPLSIGQCDLPAQRSTNAAVLHCLLRPENYYVDVKTALGSNDLDASTLIEVVSCSQDEIRVILDVGAQVLELQNEEVAYTWLSRVPKSRAQAAIFFDSENELCVIDHDKRKEPLLVSPFSKQMDQCLVYLDQSHTRGTDLKLPNDYRALVTLGPGLTKDRLVQACMRMRKLGKGQSVVFCSSMEVQRKILECRGVVDGSIEVADVLRWVISETCAYTKNCIPLWATQGIRHQNRRAEYSPGSTPINRSMLECILEPEAQSLQQRYGGDNSRSASGVFSEEALKSRELQVNEIQRKCQEFGVTSFGAAACEEEQERELSNQNEREQQVELPPLSNPCRHTVHHDVQMLARYGFLLRTSEAFLPAFETLRQTTASASFEEFSWPDTLLVTADFAKTIKATKDDNLDSFLRPVHWVISSKTSRDIEFVIVSPFEAHELLPEIRQFKRVTLHVYSPRLCSSAPSLEYMSFCPIPSLPGVWTPPAIGQLVNLFAGQLYIQSYEDYLSLCDFLGLCSNSAATEGVEIASDGFIDLASRTTTSSAFTRVSPFTKSPVPFVRMIMLMRRKGQNISFSHIGKILNGELILRERFLKDDQHIKI